VPRDAATISATACKNSLPQRVGDLRTDSYPCARQTKKLIRFIDTSIVRIDNETLVVPSALLSTLQACLRLRVAELLKAKTNKQGNNRA
jgi:hypothetical protein